MGMWALMALIGTRDRRAGLCLCSGKNSRWNFLTMLVGAVTAVVMAWIGAQIGIATQGTAIGYLVTVIGTGLVLAVWRVAMGRA